MDLDIATRQTTIPEYCIHQSKETGAMTPIALLDIVVPAQISDRPNMVPINGVGTVVEIFDDGTVLVEYSDDDGQTIDFGHYKQDQVVVIDPDAYRHAQNVLRTMLKCPEEKAVRMSHAILLNVEELRSHTLPALALDLASAEQAPTRKPMTAQFEEEVAHFMAAVVADESGVFSKDLKAAAARVLSVYTAAQAPQCSPPVVAGKDRPDFSQPVPGIVEDFHEAYPGWFAYVIVCPMYIRGPWHQSFAEAKSDLPALREAVWTLAKKLGLEVGRC